MARLQRVRPVAEQHAVGGGERQYVAGGLLPGEMLRPLQELSVLHAGELGKGAVGGLVAPDALRRREHRITAIALLVVAIVLIAMNDDFVSHLPAFHFRAHRPNDSGSVGTRDVKRVAVRIDG